MQDATGHVQLLNKVEHIFEFRTAPSGLHSEGSVFDTLASLKQTESNGYSPLNPTFSNATFGYTVTHLTYFISTKLLHEQEFHLVEKATFIDLIPVPQERGRERLPSQRFLKLGYNCGSSQLHQPFHHSDSAKQAKHHIDCTVGRGN